MGKAAVEQAVSICEIGPRLASLLCANRRQSVLQLYGAGCQLSAAQFFQYPNCRALAAINPIVIANRYSAENVAILHSAHE